MQFTTRKMQITKPIILSNRAAEIYSILREECIQLPPGSPLPSLRRVQKRFHVGQATASQALHALAESCGTAHCARTKLRKPATSSSVHKLRESILIICQSCPKNWQPLIDAYNRQSASAVVPYPVNDINDCVNASMQGKGDFVLFPSTPFMTGSVENSLAWVNLETLAADLDKKMFYPATFLADPEGRFWGIAPALNLMMLSCYRDMLDLPVQKWSWPSLSPHLEKLQEKHPGLEYAFVLDGYVTFLFDNGADMVSPGTGRLYFDEEKFSAPLLYLKDKITRGLTPRFSDIYMHHWDRMRLFSSQKTAVGQFFLSRLPAQKQVAVLPSPSAEGARHCALSEVFSICCGSLNYEAAWNFIRYTLSEPAQRYLSSAMMPVLRNLRPAWLDDDRFSIFADAASHAISRPEDYFFCHQARLMLQSGLDMWFRHGGNLKYMLKDLERSCQQCVNFTKRKF